MKKEYRVVTNQKWFEIEYKYKWWYKWFRHEPTRSGPAGYRAIDWENYRFKTFIDAVEFITKLENGGEQWHVVTPIDKGLRTANNPTPMPPVGRLRKEGEQTQTVIINGKKYEVFIDMARN